MNRAEFLDAFAGLSAADQAAVRASLIGPTGVGTKSAPQECDMTTMQEHLAQMMAGAKGPLSACGEMMAPWGFVEHPGTPGCP